MTASGGFRALVLGWPSDLGKEISRRSGIPFTFVEHPRHSLDDYGGRPPPDTLFFRRHLREPMPEIDHALLASLERDAVPSINNMVLGDRIVACLPYDSALRYATFLARRLRELFEQARPSVVISSYDGLHSALSLAVARQMRVPWFAVNFSVIPSGYACFCDTLMPRSRVQLTPPLAKVRELAEKTLLGFEQRSMHAPAYVTPAALSPLAILRRVPVRFGVTWEILRAARNREHLRYTEDESAFNLRAALRHLWRARSASRSTARFGAITQPPQRPFVLFGLHTQPESAIDVWAPFYSDQYWVVRTLARALPPSHTLLVKVHKSDAAKYSRADLERFEAILGVKVVAPFADTRQFVDRADMIVSIQGTMGLEGALLGKPVLMLGDSPVARFPSAERVGELSTLPDQFRRMLSRPRVSRESIVDAFVEFLGPFQPAMHNDWTIPKTAAEYENLAYMFTLLRARIEAGEGYGSVASA
ncbi:MAG: hypothetical protein ABI769_17735 [Pseudomonadota bacterium]